MKFTSFSLRLPSLHGPVQAMVRVRTALGLWCAGWAMQRKMASPPRGAVLNEAPNTRPPGERRAATRPVPLALPALVPKSHRDALTGLPTRACLDDAGDDLLLPLAAPGVEACALCIEVTGLAPLIERYGPAVSDAVHQQLATRLRRLARRSDTLVRLEGNRYLMLTAAPAGDGPALARAMASRAMADVQRPLSYRTLSTLRIDCCSGAAVGPITDRAALSEKLFHANEALQSALAVGPGQFRQYIAEHPIAA